MANQLTPFGKPMLKYWLFDPSYKSLNHGLYHFQCPYHSCHSQSDITRLLRRTPRRYPRCPAHLHGPRRRATRPVYTSTVCRVSERSTRRRSGGSQCPERRVCVCEERYHWRRNGAIQFGLPVRRGPCLLRVCVWSRGERRRLLGRALQPPTSKSAL